MGASTHHCWTPFVIANVLGTSPPFLTFTIIPVCRFSIMVVNFSGHPYFLSSCHCPVLPMASNAKDNIQKLILLYALSSSCRRQKIMSTVLQFEQTPHCVSGTTSGVMWLQYDPSKDLTGCRKKRYTSVITTFCSVLFFVDGDYAGILPGLWYMAFLLYFDDPCHDIPFYCKSYCSFSPLTLWLATPIEGILQIVQTSRRMKTCFT